MSLIKKYAALIVLGGVWTMVGRMAFQFNRRDRDDPDREWRERLDRIEDMLAFFVNYTLETHAMITPQIQDALDRIRQTQSLVKSVKDGITLQSTQIGTLTDKVTELQAKLDAGGTISADDLGAVAEITSDIDTVNTDLQAAIPANTKPEPTPTPAPTNPADQTNPVNPADTSGTATQPADGTQHAADADAASAAKPL